MRWLEDRVRGDARRSVSVKVITGPLYEPRGGEMRIKVMGGGVWVPTGFFKAWRVELLDGKRAVKAFRVDHAEGAQLVSVSIDELERITGVEFPEEFKAV